MGRALRPPHSPAGTGRSSRRDAAVGRAAAGRAAREVGRWGLIVALVALPVYYGLRDLVPGYFASTASRSSTATSRGSASTSSSGVSNGSIWALVAIGYTLVYGIIELINFAHGDCS